jgi:hypothetical protein
VVELEGHDCLSCGIGLSYPAMEALFEVTQIGFTCRSLRDGPGAEETQLHSLEDARLSAAVLPTEKDDGTCGGALLRGC